MAITNRVRIVIGIKREIKKKVKKKGLNTTSSDIK